MRAWPLLCLTLVACASATPGASMRPATESVRVATGGVGTELRMSPSDAVSVHKIAARPDQVWRLMPTVLDSLGIPVNVLDAAKQTIGNSGFNTRVRLKGVPLSRYIDCGNGSSGPNADSYQVNLQFIVEVQPADGGASVRTTLQAVGKPLNYAQDYSTCSSRGNLEKRVAEMISAKIP